MRRRDLLESAGVVAKRTGIRGTRSQESRGAGLLARLTARWRPQLRGGPLVSEGQAAGDGSGLAA